MFRVALLGLVACLAVPAMAEDCSTDCSRQCGIKTDIPFDVPRLPDLPLPRIDLPRPFGGVSSDGTKLALAQTPRCDAGCRALLSPPRSASPEVWLAGSIEVTEPNCKAKCETAKALACRGGITVPDLPITPREVAEAATLAACGAPFLAMTNAAIALCSNWENRLDDMDIIERSIDDVVSSGLVPPDRFAGVDIRWCPHIRGGGLSPDTNGVTPDSNHVYLHPDFKKRSRVELGALIVHEMEHIQQFRTTGSGKYPCYYSREMALCGGCQDSRNGFERAAYDIERAAVDVLRVRLQPLDWKRYLPVDDPLHTIKDSIVICSGNQPPRTSCIGVPGYKNYPGGQPCTHVRVNGLPASSFVTSVSWDAILLPRGTPKGYDLKVSPHESAATDPNAAHDVRICGTSANDDAWRQTISLQITYADRRTAKGQATVPGQAGAPRISALDVTRTARVVNEVIHVCSGAGEQFGRCHGLPAQARFVGKAEPCGYMPLKSIPDGKHISAVRWAKGPTTFGRAKDSTFRITPSESVASNPAAAKDIKICGTSADDETWRQAILLEVTYE